ncbi:hypothetical protein LIER_18642 [Lithospermum erythrorhizon]|uniref:Uncharacterized protein n=1 Tax=Lithospermum erythrorhizon TaxID=34254 RepID=A0AAV3QER2_LITER
MSPKAYDLLLKAGYDPIKDKVIGQLPPEVTGDKAYGMNDTQKMVRQKGWPIKNSTKGLGYTSKPLLRLLVNRPANHHEQSKSKARQQPEEFHFKKRPRRLSQKLYWKRVSPPTEKEPRKYISLHITEEEGESLPEDAMSAPLGLEEEVNITVDEVKEVNIGTDDEPQPTYISALLTPEDEIEYVTLLKEFKDVFSWTYKEMSGLDSKVVVHHLAVKEIIKPCPTWLTNIVPVRKKNGQIRVFVDFRDSNHPCPKDDFPLPISELMIDATMGHEVLTFMVGSSGYNQI